MREVIIDVREQDEYKAEHVPRSINVPLSYFGTMAPGVLSNLSDAKVVLLCRSGKRAQMAASEGKKLGFEPVGGYHIYPGGILAWKEKGGETIAVNRRHLPLLRQTHLGAGLLALTGVILGFSVNPLFFWLSGFVGLGLTVAGATGLCLMSEVLAKMPWNKNVPNIEQELCRATVGGDCQKS